VCPGDVFVFSGDVHRVVNPGRCILCGHCVSVCPADALRHSSLERGNFQDLPGSNPVSPGALDDFLRTRRSARVFSGKTLERDRVEELLNSTRHSPASTNTRNIRWLLIDDRKMLDELTAFTARYYNRLAGRLKNPLVRLGLNMTVGKRVVSNYRIQVPAMAAHLAPCIEGDDRLFHNAPVVAMASAPGIEHIALANINLAAAHLLLCAHARSIGTLVSGFCLTAMRRDRSMWKKLGIPPYNHLGAVIAMGESAVEFFRTPPRRKPRVEWFESET